MANRYNILHLKINGETKDQITIGDKNPQQLCEELKKVYRINSKEGNWEAYYYMESSMNTDDTKISTKHNAARKADAIL